MYKTTLICKLLSTFQKIIIEISTNFFLKFEAINVGFLMIVAFSVLWRIQLAERYSN